MYLLFSAFKDANQVQRDKVTLMNYYFKYRNSDPIRAKESLDLILAQDPNDLIATNAIINWYLQQGDTHSALEFLEKKHQEKPNNPYTTYKLMKIYASLNNPKKVKTLFEEMKYSNSPNLQYQAAVLYQSLFPVNVSVEQGHYVSIIPSIDFQQNQDFTSLYLKVQQLMRLQPHSAKRCLLDIISIDKQAYQAYVLLGYIESQQNHANKALVYFNHAFFIKPGASLALQLGYAYASLKMRDKSKNFLEYAAKHGSYAIQQQSQNALKILENNAEVNLPTSTLSQEEIRLNQVNALKATNFLPKPYFLEFYSAPFYFSRFDLGVLPIISRAGVTVNEKYHTEAYLNFRRTKDDRSGSTRTNLLTQYSISQIFEDNVGIYGLGFRFTPFPQIPLLAFVEMGDAKDLVYRQRPLWRVDARGGVVYYKTWGVKPTYSDTLKLEWKWIAPFYADAIYYSRYNNNLIGTTWFRPGFRVATYKSASLDLYMANYYLVDKNREFFNNTYTVGPGIAFRPSNRLNLVARVESLQGFYLPVNSRIPNPYAKKYYNNVAMIEFYIRF